VFIDETWTKTNMAPLPGWAPRGERLNAKVPHRRWETMTFLAALRLDRVEAPWLTDGPINGERFRLAILRAAVSSLTGCSIRRHWRLVSVTSQGATSAKDSIEWWHFAAAAGPRWRNPPGWPSRRSWWLLQFVTCLALNCLLMTIMSAMEDSDPVYFPQWAK
jgi:hypothetical protein